MLIFALGGARAVWRTGCLSSGVFVAFVSACLGGMGSIAGAASMLAIWHDPATLQAWRTSGGLDEALWGIPLLLTPLGLVTGTIGAMVSWLMLRPFSARRYR
jgi:branched-subunit amino acid ABC-type transport system permease component